MKKKKNQAKVVLSVELGTALEKVLEIKSLHQQKPQINVRKKRKLAVLKDRMYYVLYISFNLLIPKITISLSYNLSSFFFLSSFEATGVKMKFINVLLKQFALEKGNMIHCRIFSLQISSVFQCLHID